MKNKEKYMTEIIDAYLDGKTIAVKADGKPCICQKTSCKECIFYDGTNPYCRDRIRTWANSEYIERPVISKSDRRFLDCIGNTYKYIVRDKDGKLFVCKKVYTVNDEWFTRGCVAGSDYTYISGFDVQFPMVKVISPTVWSIEDLKKLEVVEAYKEACE